MPIKPRFPKQALFPFRNIKDINWKIKISLKQFHSKKNYIQLKITAIDSLLDTFHFIILCYLPFKIALLHATNAAWHLKCGTCCMWCLLYFIIFFALYFYSFVCCWHIKLITFYVITIFSWKMSTKQYITRNMIRWVCGI